MFYIIYKTINLLNGKIYLGKHQTDNLEDYYLGSGLLITEAIKKYGKNNFKKEILFIFDNEKEMNSKEKELITEEIVKDPNYYNIALGGEGGPLFKNKKHSEETKKKMSQSKKGKTTPEETKKKLSAKLSGRTFSEETKKKMSESKLKMTEETKDKMKKNALNRSPELQRKMTEASTGWNHSLETKKKLSQVASNRSTETKKKMSEANTGKKFYFNIETGDTIYTHNECPIGYIPGRYSDYIRKVNNKNDK
jgi:group I intron endonuclease